MREEKAEFKKNSTLWPAEETANVEQKAPKEKKQM